MTEPKYEQLLTIKDICVRFAYSPKTLLKARKNNEFPQPTKTDGRPMWAESVVNEWWEWKKSITRKTGRTHLAA